MNVNKIVLEILNFFKKKSQYYTKLNLLFAIFYILNLIRFLLNLHTLCRIHLIMQFEFIGTLNYIYY